MMTRDQGFSDQYLRLQQVCQQQNKRRALRNHVLFFNFNSLSFSLLFKCVIKNPQHSNSKNF